MGTGGNFTVVDTPGFGDSDGEEPELINAMVKYLKNEIKETNIFLLLFNGQSQRVHSGLQCMHRFFTCIKTLKSNNYFTFRYHRQILNQLKLKLKNWDQDTNISHLFRASNCVDTMSTVLIGKDLNGIESAQELGLEYQHHLI